MPYENGGFVDYNILTNPPITQYRTIDYADYVVNTPAPITVDWSPHIETIDEKLEKFAKKIYKIIEEHCNIDISEEEFMAVLNDEGE